MDIGAILADAKQRIEEITGDPAHEQDLLWYSWPQMWGSTSRGFGGIGGAAMTRAQTLVVIYQGFRPAIVYVDGRFAYAIRQPNSAFWDKMRKFRLPGTADAAGRAQIEAPEWPGASPQGEA